MQIERVTDVGVLEAIYRLRVTAWRARDVGFPELQSWHDEYDEDALHWAAFSDGHPVAAARLTVHDTVGEMPDAGIYRHLLAPQIEGPIGLFTRLVVAPSHAQLGLPELFDRIRLDHARRMGCVCVLADVFPRTGRLQSLEEIGFEILGRAGASSKGALAVVKVARGNADIVCVNWLVPEARPVATPVA